MNVIIDGVEYVPKSEIPLLNDASLNRCIQELVSIQYFSECTNKHRAWAWDALNAIAPDIANMSPDNAYAIFRGEE